MPAALYQLENISKIYPGEGSAVRALDSVSLTIDSGEFIALLGPSGSGKSTLMHLLGIMDRPTSGTLLYRGRDIGHLTAREQATIRSREIGFVFQAFNLLPRLSLLENVMLPLLYARAPQAQARELAQAVIAKVGLSDRQSHLPSQLSGGQRQRGAMARALVNSPQLLLADEPTGNLDSENSAKLLELFSQLHSEGRTIVLVTHDPEVARAARRRLSVKDGRIHSQH